MAQGSPDGDYLNQKRRLIGALGQFHAYLNIHVQAICQGGIFDRFPKVQIIDGHLGENLVHTPLRDRTLISIANAYWDGRSSRRSLW